MNDQTQSGTVERENMKPWKEVEPQDAASKILLKDYAEWIRQCGFTKNSPKDHLIKLTPFWRFLRRKELLNDVTGLCPLHEIDRDVMADYQVFVFDYVSPHTGKKLACSTQINALSYLVSFFKFLKKTRRIALNPTDIIKLPHHPQLLPAALLKPDEMRKLMEMPNVKTVIGFRDRTILEVLWSTAPRVEELCSLTLKDVNFEDGLLAIREGKGERERILPLGESARAWLQEYLRTVRPLFLTRKRVIVPSNHLFLNRYGTELYKQGWEAKMRVYGDRAKISPKFTSHSFRHQLASDMLKNGADLRHIQQMLGHENLTTTQRYLHVVKGQLQKVHAQTHPREAAPALPVHYRGSHEDE